MPNPTYEPHELAPEVIKVGDKLHEALDEITEDNDIFSDISTAIQGKTGQAEPYAKEDIADTISDDLVFPSGTLNISSNGDYDVSAKETAHVAVPSPNLQSKVVTPSISRQSVTPDGGYDGLSDVTVNATPLESKSVTPTAQQQVVTPTAPNIGLSSVTVGAAPQPTLITKQITANGTYAAEDDNADGYSEVAVDVPVPTPIEEKDVNFYDFDGTLLCGYTFQEATNMSALPALPSHTGLVAQAWTHTLSSVNTAGENSRPLNVGCMYNTSDSATRLYFYYLKGASPSITIKIILAPNSSVTIDWGNGDTSTLENTSSSVVNADATKSDYSVITSETILCVSISGGSFVAGQLSTSVNQFISPASNLIKAELGANCTKINNYAFANCSSLETITLPNSIAEIGTYAFSYCKMLKSATIPSGVTQLLYHLFEYCHSITLVVIPDSVINIGSHIFSYCYSIRSIEIPDGLSISSYMAQYCYALNTIRISGSSSYTILNEYSCRSCLSLQRVVIKNIASINGNSFSGCSCLSEIDMTDYTNPASIPYLSSNSPFSGYSITLRFVFANQEMLDAFASATNWSQYADRFQIKGATP